MSEEILQICLKAILLVMCIFNCTLLLIMIIRSIKDIKADKEYNELRAQHLLAMENFFKERVLSVEERCIEEENSEQKEDKKS